MIGLISLAKINNLFISFYFYLVKLFLWNPFIKKTLNPAYEQNLVLRSILEKNKDTVIGKKYGFSQISSYEDFKNSVQVHNYEMLRGYIEKQERTKEPYLTNNKTIAYVQTSGTTDKPKFIPIFDTTVRNYKNNQRISTYAQYKEIPSMLKGGILAIASPAIEGELDSGTPYGSLSGMVYKDIPMIIRSKYVLPYEVFDIDDYDERYFLISALGIAQKSVTTLVAVNPSTILKLSEIINERINDLIDIIEKGKINSSFDISDRGRGLIRKYLKKNRTRAEELRTICRGNQKINLEHIWPDLKAVVTWTGGNCGLLIPSLLKQLKKETRIFEMGYISSEFRGSIVVDSLKGDAVPVISENFYEFIERDDWELGKKNYQTIEQIEERKQYYILVTTPYGLYRYFINDIIEVTGNFNNTPTIKFVQKGRGFTNITGEKLYEDQIIKVLGKINERNDTNIDFFVFLANPKELMYEMFLECEPVYDIDISVEIDEELKKLNIEYKNKRESGRLKPIELFYLKSGTGDKYKKYCIRSGQREAQFKFVHLLQKDECNFDFRSFS